MPEAALELPYEGAKEMLLVDDVENREFLRELFDAMYDELPEKKRNKTLEYSYQFLSIYFKVPWYNFRNRRLP